MDNSRMTDMISNALNIAWSYGQIDGEHHKMWVIDKIVQALCGTEDNYRKWVEAYEEPFFDEGVKDWYKWDTGIAP